MEKISFVIPCYRSERIIRRVVDEIVETVEKQGNFQYEVILVSDHSPDQVFSVARELARENPCIKGLEFTRNFGQHAALMAGYRHCTGDYIVSMDDDGQTPADEVFKLIQKLDEGYDVVFAKYAAIQQSGFRRLGSRINAWMSEMMIGKPKELVANSYFVMKRYILEEIIRYENPYPYLSGLVFRATQNIANVTVRQRKRMDGSSGYDFKRLLAMWMNGFTAFSVKPLRMATLAGGILSCLGFLYGIYTVVNKIIRPSVLMGYSSMMATILFIGGMLMLILGMIGEYVGRIYICLNRSPQYVVKEKVNMEQDHTENQ